MTHFYEISFNKMFTHLPFLIAEEHPMRKQDCTTAGFRIEALQNVLEERVIRTPLRRRPEEVAPVLVCGKRFPIPLLNGIRRIGQHQIELLQPPVFDESGPFQRIVVDDLKVFHTVQEKGSCGRWPRSAR